MIVHTAQQPYRELHDSILEYEGEDLFTDVVRPWLSSATAEKRWLDDLRGRARPHHPMSQEENWRLYALSRIVELLSIGLTPARVGLEQRWHVAELHADEFAAAMENLGLERVEQAAFSPFYHEVASVEQTGDDTTPPSIISEFAPGFRVGALLIARARCQVSSGRNHLVGTVAEMSTLYWAFARNNRPVTDLSAGWGSNSQWRTPFRTDYAYEGTLFFNADPNAHCPAIEDDASLNLDEQLELLRHRCFVRCSKDHADLWPYDWSAEEGA